MVKPIRSISGKNKSTINKNPNENRIPIENPYKKPKVIPNNSSSGLNKWMLIGFTLLSLLLLMGVFSPSINPDEIPNSNNFGEDELIHNQDGEKFPVMLYSSETCGCCHNYVAYLNENGFDVFQKRGSEYIDIKNENGIPDDKRSCHTAIIGEYFVEGHIPIHVVYDLLESGSEIDGIALPEMPSGSPGMTGEKSGQWDIFSIMDGNTVGIYMTV